MEKCPVCKHGKLKRVVIVACPVCDYMKAEDKSKVEKGKNRAKKTNPLNTTLHGRHKSP